MMSFRAERAARSQGIRTLLVAALLSVPASTDAQSTTNVGHYERPIQFDVFVGTEFADERNEYPCCSSGPLRMLSAGVRWRPVDDGGFRLGVLNAARTTESTFFTSNGGKEPGYVRERLLAFTLSADYFLRLINDFGASVSVGVAFAPYVKGRLERSEQNGYPAPYDVSERSILYTGSLGLRYRWIFVEQHLMILGGANNAIRENREFYPVSVGLRF
jgi:hypothetical protein